MALERTSILPLDDKNAAKILLEQCLQKNKTTITIIIGNSQAIKDAIPIADFNARIPPQDYERWVVWAKEREFFKDMLVPLLVGTTDHNADLNYEDINCFSLSPVSRKAAGIIHKNTKLTDFRLSRSTVFAEAKDAII